MIKSLHHAHGVSSRRKAKGLRGLPRAVTRYMRRTASFRDLGVSRGERAKKLKLEYNG